MKNSTSQDVNNFCEELEQLLKLLGKTFRERTPHLKGEKFLTNHDVYKALHISGRTLQEYRDRGLLPYIQISGGKVLYKESDILKLLEDNYYAVFNWIK